MRLSTCGPKRLPAREGEKLAHKARGPVGVLLDLHDVLEGRIGGPVVGEQQIAVADDRLQHVVEIVRHAAGKLAHRVHLLRLRELFLDLAEIRGVESVENGQLAIGGVVAHRRHPDTHRAALFAGGVEFEGRNVAETLGGRFQGGRHLRAFAVAERFGDQRSLAAFAGARERAEKPREWCVCLQQAALPIDGRDGNWCVVEEPCEAHFGGALTLVDIKAWRPVEHQRTRRAHGSVLPEGDAVIEPHGQELAVAAAQIEIEGFGAHAAGLARERCHHRHHIARHHIGKTQTAGADLCEIVIEPRRQGGVEIDDVAERIDRHEPGRRVIEIIDRVLQFLKDVFLPLALMGDIRDGP